MSYICDDVFREYYSTLSKKSREEVFKAQGERTKAILDWYDGKMERDAARRIVAKCNAKIEQIAKGAAVL